MNKEEKFKLITQGLQEVVGEDKIKQILEKRDLKIYIGTAPTGNPHFGYYTWIYKIAEFLKAECEVTILFANIHAYLDNMKSTWELLEHRTNYYEFLIKEMLTLIGVPLDKLKFVKGTDFQLSKEYTLDLYKMTAITSTRDTKRAGAEVVKQLDNPKMSSLLYPILQALDEEYLKVDAQFGGLDQRKIFMLAREFLPKIGYEKRIHLMNPLVPGLGEGGKMSSSDANSKIDFMDTDKQIRKKINKAFSKDGEVENNGILAILKYVIFKRLNEQKKDFIIDRPQQYGGKITYKTYEDVEKDFAESKLSSIDLKQGVATEIINFISPLREKINSNIELFNKAYPKK